MTYDYVMFRMFMDPKDPQVMEILRHHEISLAGITSCFYVGYGIPSIMNIVLICEISTIFLNYNLIKGDDAPLFTQIIFVIFFVVIRIILMPYLFVLYLIQARVLWGKVIVARKLAIIVAGALYFGMNILNFYWLTIIIKSIRDMISPPNTSEDDRDDYKKVYG